MKATTETSRIAKSAQTARPAERGLGFAGVLSGAGAVLLFGVTILAINVLQTMSLVILPLAPRAFRRVNRWFANTWWTSIALWIRNVSRVETIFSGDALPPGENTIVVANHQSMADIPAIFPLGSRSHQLGDMKWFAKDILKYIPGIGWGMFFLDCIYLKRDWSADQSRIERTFSRLRAHAVPFWLVAYVEGTRVRPEKVERSQEFARKNGLPILKNTLIPRTKGFTASMQGLRQNIAAVYDVTVGYEGGAPTLWQFICGRTRRVHVHVRRYEEKSLPKAEAELARWLLERFVEKDERLGRFKEIWRFV